MSTTACPIVIKVPVHTGYRRATLPSVAARLQAREKPERKAVTEEKDARRELLVAAAQARKAATAALHNKRVNEQRSSAIRMKTTIEHYTRSTINRRLKEAEALRESRLRAKAIKAKAFIDRVDHVAERNDARKAELQAQYERKLEAAAQKRERRLANRQFAAADATARAKSIALERSRESETIARRLSDRIFEAAHRRDAQLDIVASKAAFFNERAVRVAAHKRAARVLDARVIAAGIQSKQAAADYLRSLDLRLRQQRAALTNERAAIVVERQRLSQHIQPMVAGAKLRAEQFMASERRSEALFDIQNKAHKFIRRAVVTCANNEVQNRRLSEHKRANLEERLAAAERRKEELLLCGVSMAGGGPSPTRRPRGVERVSSPALSDSMSLALRIDGFALAPPQGGPVRRPASAIGVMNTAHAVHAIAARPDRPVTARGLKSTTRAAHDSVTSEESARSDDDDDGVIVFQTPEQTSRPSTRGSSRHTASGGSNDWTHVSAPVSPTASA
uniref:Uncharacterized protein n=1 Tax=Micromonas pusilla TaxID=38833 RepID=A0A7S0I994_MICPS|mmetsp:Transcript_12556/g.52980  ORF Transcript_12556/g.52980 Transcript_12556/m.52980 type:complete len:507 (+) Transcript_12556:934-2454(+)